MKISKLSALDRGNLLNLIEKISLFNQEERDVIVELFDDMNTSDDYIFWGIHSDDNQLCSFICYGPTPMTKGTFDMYWIGTSDHFQGKGLARRLMDHMKLELSQKNGRLIRIETSSKDTYQQTRIFYQRMGMKEGLCIKNFYDIGDDLIVYVIEL
ncbi:GNAT family N-acetyltransferase [Myxococcota bacterium]|nr:GNAT family N-acetyltransferase [Myxococcota bacterium]MBU1900254.1 GNAT family N-acetyltransferase [Myxococcota bacterium]